MSSQALIVNITQGREVRSPRKQYRFTVVSGGNHLKLAKSTEGYNNLDDCARAAAIVTGCRVVGMVGTQEFDRPWWW